MGLLSVCQSVILSVSVTVSLSVFPSTYQTVCLGVCQSVSCSDVMPGVLRRTLSLVGGSLVHCVAEVAAVVVAQSTEMGVMFTVVAAAAVVKGTTAW